MKTYERFNERAARIANRFEKPQRQSIVNVQVAGQQQPGFPLPLIQDAYEMGRRRR